MNRVAKLEDEARKELASYYMEMISTLGLEEYKKSSEICAALNMNDREWRKIVEDISHLYMYNYVDKMIIGTTKGYLLTDDKELINKVLKAKEHQFKSLAYNCYNLKKAIKHKDNYTMEDYLIDNLCEQ